MNDIADINWLYETYYKDNPVLKKIVLKHSRMVARKALEIAKAKSLDLDPRDIFCAALLHDIGVIECYAPSIHADGHLPYLQHGIAGKTILERHGLSKYARVCERHTGSGISMKEIIDNKLPLPPKDMLPETQLEKLICYADKFYSKSKELEQEKTIDQIRNQIKKFGSESLKRFEELHSLFSL